MNISPLSPLQSRKKAKFTSKTNMTEARRNTSAESSRTYPQADYSSLIPQFTPISHFERRNTMKAFITYWFNWLFSKKVLEAINNGLSYDEVDRIARGE